MRYDNIWQNLRNIDDQTVMNMMQVTSVISNMNMMQFTNKINFKNFSYNRVY